MNANPIAKACLIVPVAIERNNERVTYVIENSHGYDIRAQLAQVLMKEAKLSQIEVDSRAIDITIQRLFERFEVAFENHKKCVPVESFNHFLYECTFHQNQTILLAFSSTLKMLGISIPMRT